MSEINLASHLNEVFTTIGEDIKALYQRANQSGSNENYIASGDLNDYTRGTHLIKVFTGILNMPDDMLGGILHVSAVGNGTLMQLFMGFNRSIEFQIYTRQGWAGGHSWDRDRISWGNWARFENNMLKHLVLVGDGSDRLNNLPHITFTNTDLDRHFPAICMPRESRKDQILLSFNLFSDLNTKDIATQIHLPNKSGEILVRRSDPELRWSGNATNGQRIHLGPLYDEHLILCLQASQHHSLADENPVHFSTVYIPFSKSDRVTTTINGNRFIYGSAFYFQGWKQTKIKLHEDAIELMDLSAMLLKAVYSM